MGRGGGALGVGLCNGAGGGGVMQYDGDWICNKLQAKQQAMLQGLAL